MVLFILLLLILGLHRSYFAGHMFVKCSKTAIWLLYLIFVSQITLIHVTKYPPHFCDHNDGMLRYKIHLHILRYTLLQLIQLYESVKSSLPGLEVHDFPTLPVAYILTAIIIQLKPLSHISSHIHLHSRLLYPHTSIFNHACYIIYSEISSHPISPFHHPPRTPISYNDHPPNQPQIPLAHPPKMGQLAPANPHHPLR